MRLYRRTRDITEVNGLSKWMLIPNMKIKDFKQGLKRAKIRLENDAVDDQLAQILVETYAWAQFVYGQSIRRCFADSSNYLDQLKSQLDGFSCQQCIMKLLPRHRMGSLMMCWLTMEKSYQLRKFLLT